MKISSFIMILLMIGMVFFVFSQMASEANTKYGPKINNTDWETKYNYVSRVNSTISPLKSSFDNIEDDNIGWFSKLTSGIAAIPRAVIALPALLVSSFSIGGEMISNFATALGVPVFILNIFLTALIVWGIFKLIEAFQRWNV